MACKPKLKAFSVHPFGILLIVLGCAVAVLVHSVALLKGASEQKEKDKEKAEAEKNKKPEEAPKDKGGAAPKEEVPPEQDEEEAPAEDAPAEDAPAEEEEAG